MPKLELQLLGTPLWLLDGAPLKGFVTRKSEALLIYLAVEQQMHRRSTLASYFWPDIADQHAHNSLRRALSNLRKLAGSHLLIDRYTAAFDTQSAYSLDLEQFTKILAPITQKVQTQPSIADLEHALSLYRDEFLTGFLIHDALPFEEWLRSKRENLHELAISALDKLTSLYMQQQKFDAGLATTHRLLTMQPWRETAHQQRMRLLSITNQQTRALAQFELCRKILLKEFGTEPNPETVALYQQIKAGTLEAWKVVSEQSLPLEVATMSPSNPAHTATDTADMQTEKGIATPSKTQVDWGEMPRAVTFFGREEELAQLQQWLSVERCTVVTILGVGGFGKTTLAAQLVRTLSEGTPDAGSAETFTHIIWRSLVNAPPLKTLLHQWLVILSEHEQTKLPDQLPNQLELLFTYLRQQRCLLVLDNLESLFDPTQEAGVFRAGYEEYGLFLRQMGETQHPSSLLLTSREQPVQVARLEREYPQVQSLLLHGLQPEPAIKVLQSVLLSGMSEQLTTLVARYSGNPLALKLIAETIQDFYGSDIDAFLAENTLVFDDIRHVLDQQFQRLLPLEREILYWLAIAREPLSMEQLQSRLIELPNKRLFIEALRSLQRRSLLESMQPSQTDDEYGFQLQNVVTEYLINQLLDLFHQEITATKPDLFHRFGLISAQSKEYIRATQQRLFLQPLLKGLLALLGYTGIERRLAELFRVVRTQPPKPHSFAVANLIHLWQALGVDISGFDFSQLCIREADVRGVHLSKVNLSNANLPGTVFSEIFNAALSLAYSPDGQILAVATTDGVVRLWQVTTRQLLASCPGNGRWVWSVSFSSDGKFLATGCADRMVRIWQIEGIRSAGQAVELSLYHLLGGHTDAVFSVCFHPNNRQLASASADGTIRIWEKESSCLLQTLTGHSDAINSLAYNSDGSLLASGSRDQSIRLWDVSSGQCKLVLQPHGGEVRCVFFHPSDELLASASSDQTVRIWRTSNGTLYRSIRSNTPEIQPIAFSPDGETIAVNDADFSIRLWNIESGSIHRTLLGHTDMIQAIAFSPNGKTVVSAGWDRTVRFWDAKSGNAVHTLQGYRNIISSITIGQTANSHPQSNHEQWLAHGNSNHQIYLWDLLRGEQMQILSGHSAGVGAVDFHPNGKLLVSGSTDKTVRLWQIDRQKSRLLHTLYGHTGDVSTVTFSADGKIFASASDDQQIRLWQTATGRLLQILHSHPSPINKLTFCPIPYDAAYWLFSCDDESNLYTWKIPVECINGTQVAESNRPDRKLNDAPPHGIHALAVDSNGRYLAAAGAEQFIQLWQLPEMQQIGTLKGHTSSIYGLAFNQNGSLLASSSGDQTIQIWELKTGNVNQTLYGHQGVVESVTFHPNGEWLISSSSDETLKIWSLSTGECIQTLRPASLYEGMDITGVTGITAAQQATLRALGAVESASIM